MYPEYYVIAKEPCPDCNGSGWTSPSAWITYHIENYKQIKETGIPIDLDAYFKNLGYEYPPDEESDCHICNGTGRIENEVPLQEALQQLAERNTKK